MFSVHYNVLFSSSVMLFSPFCSKPAPPSVLFCFVVIFELFLLHPWSQSVILQWEAVVRNYVLLSVDIFVFCLVGLLFLFGFILVLSGAVGSKIRQWLSPYHVEVDLSPTQQQQCWELGTYDLFSVAWMSGDCRWGVGEMHLSSILGFLVVAPMDWLSPLIWEVCSISVGGGGAVTGIG